MRNKITALLICCLLFVHAFGFDISFADTVDNHIEAINGIIAYNLNKSGAKDIQEWIDKDLAEYAGISSEGYAFALNQYQEYDMSKYAESLKKYLGENTVKSASTREKYAICLGMVYPEDEYISETADNSIGELGIMSYVFGLHMLNNGYESSVFSAQEIVDTILSLRHEDGGWSVMGNYGDIDVTAMVLQAFAGTLETGNAAISEEIIDVAIDFLSKRQSENGDFSSFGTYNCESTAQVIIALSALNIDCKSDNRFVKNGNSAYDGMMNYMCEDGSFSHTIGGDTDSLATVQSFTALIAYDRMLNGKSSFYITERYPEELLPDVIDSETDASDAEYYNALKADDDVTVNEDAVNRLSSNLVLEGGTQTIDNSGTDALNYKFAACIFVIAAGILTGAVLFIRRKRNIRNYIFIAGITVLACLLIVFTTIELPEKYYSETNNAKNVIGQVTITIRCDTIAGKYDSEFIPKDGIIVPDTVVDIEAGDTVYDVLIEIIKRNGIHIDSTSRQDRYVYISGINNLYEFDYGELSGWMYRVNKVLPSVGCGEYELAPGDYIEWLYTCEIGNDFE